MKAYVTILTAQQAALQKALDRHIIDYATDAPGMDRDGLYDEVRFNDWCDLRSLWQ